MGTWDDKEFKPLRPKALPEAEEPTWIEEEELKPGTSSQSTLELFEELTELTKAFVSGSTTHPVTHPSSRFPFRRRCGWCGKQLRLWQHHLCRGCKSASFSFGSSPCPQGSRWDAEPDRWRWRP